MSGELTAANAKIQRKAAEEPNSGFRFVSNTDLAGFFSVIFAQTQIMMSPNFLICQNFVDAENGLLPDVVSGQVEPVRIQFRAAFCEWGCCIGLGQQLSACSASSNVKRPKSLRWWWGKPWITHQGWRGFGGVQALNRTKISLVHGLKVNLSCFLKPHPSLNTVQAHIIHLTKGPLSHQRSRLSDYCVFCPDLH